MDRDREIGAVITRLIARRDLGYEEAREAFRVVLAGETTELQQGAFLAALRAKGETADEMAGAWHAVYHLDTIRAEGLDGLALVDNSGTGMDSLKTFNISTAASVVAAAAGARMARHGARALSSMRGTVDMAEALGVDVEAPVPLVSDSVRRCGLGLYNGTSPTVHPAALGRLLSRMHFGSTLNVSASLANPALPRLAVRGVHSPDAMRPVAALMRRIGYERAIIVHGRADGSERGMDEASVCGPTLCLELRPDGTEAEYAFRPEDYGLSLARPEDLAPEPGLDEAVRGFVALVSGRGSGERAGAGRARTDAVALNAALILYVAGLAASIDEGLGLARGALEDGRALSTLRAWVECQNRDPARGLERLEALAGGA